MLKSIQLRTLIAKIILRLRGSRSNSFIQLRQDARSLCRELCKDMGLIASDAEISTIVDAALEKISLSSDVGIAVSSERIREDLWLDHLNPDFPYFKRFDKFLKLRKGWLDTDSLDKDSYSIIQMLGNPKEENHRRGLLIGDVQSGKTASYTAILNRAVDVKYDVIVLLAGSLENLRRQTQERIDKELVGSTLDLEGDGKTFKTVGVGEFAITSSLKTQTTTKRDFTSTTRNSTESKIEGRSLLFVAKKNVTSLETILVALQEDNSSLIDDSGRIKGSILVIDDEADNASVNTKKNSDSDPTKINGGIRKLLAAFTKTSYLAVTATPFANIYIDDTTESEMYGDDLFPSDFIHLLSRPSGYTGAFKLFGDFSPSEDQPFDFKNCIIKVKEDDIPEDSFVFKHKKENVVIGSFDTFPNTLQKAVRYFLLVQYLMDYLPNVEKPHRTMMINVSRFVSIQNGLAKEIKLWLEETFLPCIQQWHNIPEAADNPNSREFFYLKRVWEEFELASVSNKTWDEICPGLYDAVSKVRISAENMSKYAKTLGRLNYENYPDGDRVISVGGQCLSRGLTLENLVVSYFYRNSAAYDTLLQMGRWFGYRNPYLKYFRIWMADASVLWYKLVSEAGEDLRAQIDDMNMLGMEPREFGLMVRRHPYAGLIITARSKMRKAKVGNRRPTNLDGRLIESPRLWKDYSPNSKNAELVKDFLLSISGAEKDDNGNVIVRNVEKADIYPFISAFDSADLSIGFNVSQLSDYVLKNTGMKWDVAISSGNSKVPVGLEIGDCFKETIFAISRPAVDDGVSDSGKSFVRVNDHHVRIGTGSITKLGLTNKQLLDLERKYKSEGHSKEWKYAKQTASVYLRAQNEDCTAYRNPLLLLYPLFLWKNEGEKLFDSVVWGIGIGFPGITGEKHDRYFEYWLNPVAIRNQMKLGEEEGDDEDDDE